MVKSAWVMRENVWVHRQRQIICHISAYRIGVIHTGWPVCTPAATRASGNAWISWLVCGRRAIPARPRKFVSGDLIAGSDVIRGHPQRAAGLGGLKPWSAPSPPAPATTRRHPWVRARRRRWPADDLQLGRSKNLPTGQTNKRLMQSYIYFGLLNRSKILIK